MDLTTLEENELHKIAHEQYQFRDAAVQQQNQAQQNIAMIEGEFQRRKSVEQAAAAPAGEANAPAAEVVPAAHEELTAPEIPVAE